MSAGRSVSLSICSKKFLLRGFLSIPSFLFGQRPQSGRSPVENKGTFVHSSICPFFCLSICSFTPPIRPLRLLGLKRASLASWASNQPSQTSNQASNQLFRPQIRHLRPYIGLRGSYIWPLRPLIIPLGLPYPATNKASNQVSQASNQSS